MNQSVNYDRIERNAKIRAAVLKTVIYSLLGIWALIRILGKEQ